MTSLLVCLHTDTTQTKKVWTSMSGAAPTTGIPAGAVMAFDLASCPDGWSLFASTSGRTIIGASAEFPLNQIGGEQTHTLTEAEMPKHRHGLGRETVQRGTLDPPQDVGGGTPLPMPGWGLTSFVGENAPHNNMQPYVALLYCKKQ